MRLGTMAGAWIRVATAVLAALAAAAPVPAETPVTIGFLLDGAWERNAEITSLVEGEILALTEGEMDVRFPAAALRVADWSGDGVRRAAEELLADPDVDLIIALGTLATHVFCCHAELPKPVVAPLVVDAELQGFPRSGAGSGVRNLVYVAFPIGFPQDLAALRRVVPVRHLAILASAPLLESVPAVEGGDASLAANLGVTLSRIEVPAPATDAEVDVARSLLLPRVEASALGLLDGRARSRPPASRWWRPSPPSGRRRSPCSASSRGTRGRCWPTPTSPPTTPRC